MDKMSLDLDVVVFGYVILLVEDESLSCFDEESISSLEEMFPGKIDTDEGVNLIVFVDCSSSVSIENWSIEVLSCWVSSVDRTFVNVAVVVITGACCKDVVNSVDFSFVVLCVVVVVVVSCMSWDVYVWSMGTI